MQISNRQNQNLTVHLLHVIFLLNLSQLWKYIIICLNQKAESHPLYHLLLSYSLQQVTQPSAIDYISELFLNIVHLSQSTLTAVQSKPLIPHHFNRPQFISLHPYAFYFYFIYVFMIDKINLIRLQIPEHLYKDKLTTFLSALHGFQNLSLPFSHWFQYFF